MDHAINYHYVKHFQEEELKIRDRLKHVRSYRTLTRAVADFQLPAIASEDLTPTFDDVMVDDLSLPLIPSDSPGTPVQKMGDGNCLPRTASLFTYNTQDNHEEMRYRILQELVQNADYYLSKDLDKGGESKDCSKTFAMFSEFYKGQRLTLRCIKNIYEQELLSIKTLGSYMGAWQVASLATILGRVVYSVYPEYGAATVRKDLHRVFYPRDMHVDEFLMPPLHILWTNIQGVDLKPKEWRPNHFVLLIPRY